MSLQFALRPRFDLERPPPRRRRFGWLRLPPLAVPIVAYWLAIAGATHALIGVATAEPSDPSELEEGSPPPPVMEGASSEAPASLETSTRVSAEPPIAELPPQPVEEEAEPVPVAALADPEPPRERVVPPELRAPPPPLERKVVARDEPAPVVRTEVPVPKRAALEEPAERPAEPPRESPKDVVREETSRGEQPGPLPSCESAAASADETIDLRGGARRAPDLTRDAFASVLENGAYLGRCAIPARTALEICAAVRDGKVVGVSVTTAPRDPAVAACVRRAVAGLRFPRSERLDVTRTRFEPAL